MRNQVEKILNDEYGVGIVVASDACVLWAAAKTEKPLDAVDEVNKVRMKYDKPTVLVPYRYFESLQQGS